MLSITSDVGGDVPPRAQESLLIAIELVDQNVDHNRPWPVKFSDFRS